MEPSAGEEDGTELFLTKKLEKMGMQLVTNQPKLTGKKKTQKEKRLE
jgi:hypothetical protein